MGLERKLLSPTNFLPSLPFQPNTLISHFLSSIFYPPYFYPKQTYPKRQTYIEEREGKRGEINEQDENVVGTKAGRNKEKEEDFGIWIFG